MAQRLATQPGLLKQWGIVDGRFNAMDFIRRSTRNVRIQQALDASGMTQYVMGMRQALGSRSTIESF
jgi:hypothetical protein